MLSLIAQLIKPLINEQQHQYQNDLDRFITSKQPTTTSEVEYWQREYDRRQNTGSWLS
jgi:hypothetical protein